jgi:hypothetical protein
VRVAEGCVLTFMLKRAIAGAFRTWYPPTRPHGVITQEARSNRNSFEWTKNTNLQNADKEVRSNLIRKDITNFVTVSMR